MAVDSLGAGVKAAGHHARLKGARRGFVREVYRNLPERQNSSLTLLLSLCLGPTLPRRLSRAATAAHLNLIRWDAARGCQ